MIYLFTVPLLLLFMFSLLACVDHYANKSRELAEFILNPPPFDCCMCGSDVNSHGWGDGHAPVSMYDYYSRGITEGLL